MNNLIFNGMHIDHYPRLVEGQNKTLVFLPGIPGEPKNYYLITRFTHDGYDVFVPHYEGTWGSEGVMLKCDPSLSVDEFIKSLGSKEVYIIGFSFGGWVGWGLKDSDLIKKVCLLSPVISFRNVRGIETLGGYLKKAFPNNYRFDDQDWSRLVDDNLRYLGFSLLVDPVKLMILAGKDDEQIDCLEIKSFAEKNNIVNFHVLNTGHISPSKVDGAQLEIIENFFSSSSD